MATPEAERDHLRARMARTAEIAGDTEWEECLYSREVGPGMHVKLPRWRVSANWIEFECGCVAERTARLVGYVPGDPVIFLGQTHQAVYEEVCDRHREKMEFRIGVIAPGMDWSRWYAQRRHVLMGRSR